MTCFNIFALTLCYIAIVASILLIVMSGIGFSYFNNSILIYSPGINMRVLFGCGIGVGILLLFGLVLYLFISSLIIHYILTFPLMIVMCSLYIAYTRESQIDKIIDFFSYLWTESIATREFQLTAKCCGWNNATDRSLVLCPMEYESGCKNFLYNFLRPRYNSIFISSIVILCLLVVSLFPLSLIFFIKHDGDSILDFAMPLDL